MNGKKPARLNKKTTLYDFFFEYNDLFYVIACVFVVLMIILVFIGACAYFNVSFTESGMIRNFLNGGVQMKFKVVGEDDCFYYLLKDSDDGIFKISKYRFHSFDAKNKEEYFEELEEYVGIYYELLISDNILSEIESIR